MEKISVVVPCYNEEKSLPFFYDEMKKVMKKMSNSEFELIFVNDGSKDKTIDVIKEFEEMIKELDFYLFQEILVKRRRCTLDLKKQQVIT